MMTKKKCMKANANEEMAIMSQHERNPSLLSAYDPDMSPPIMGARQLPTP